MNTDKDRASGACFASRRLRGSIATSASSANALSRSERRQSQLPSSPAPQLPKFRFALALGLLAATLAAWPQPASAQSEGATRQFAAAVALQNKGEYELAAAEWNKFIANHKADPRVPRASHYLGVCYYQTKAYDKAADAFQTVIKTFPQFEMLESTQFFLGLTYSAQAQSGKKGNLYAKAAEAFAAAYELGKKEKDPSKSKHLVQSLMYRGDALYYSGDKKGAVAVYADLVEHYPDDRMLPDALYALGVAQEELKDTEAAGKTYERFLAKFPNHTHAPEVTMRWGETLFAAKKYEDAAKAFATAAKAKDFKLAPQAAIRQGTALVMLKRVKQAAELFAAGDEPGREAAHVAARHLLANKGASEALALLDAVLPKAAESKLLPQLLLDRGDALYELGRLKEAAEVYTGLAAKYPKEAVGPQATYLAALAALNSKDFVAALKQADAFLTAHPKHQLGADVRYVAAEAQMGLEKYAEAEKAFADLLKDQPKHADAPGWELRRGLAILLQGRYRDVIAQVEPSLKSLKAPEQIALAQYLIGRSQLELGEVDKAVKSLEAAVAAAEKWPQAEDALLSLAHAYQKAKDPEKAKTTLARLLKDYPSSRVLDQVHHRLGEIAFQAGDWKMAAAEYQWVLDKAGRGPLAPFAYYGLAWSKLNAGEHAAAEKAVDALVEKYPEQKLIARARYARGMARYQLNKHEPALEDIQTFLKADPTPAERADALYVQGLCQAALKKYADAAATYESILKQWPGTPIADKVYYELGWAYKELDKPAQAAAAFAKLVSVAPEGKTAAESHYHVGEQAYKDNDFKKAAEQYRQALSKAGKGELAEKAAHKLAWCLFKLDDFEAARAAFAEQRKQWPRGPLASDAAFMEGECLLKQEKYAEALAAYAAAKKPTSPVFGELVLLHSAQAASQLKKWPEALAFIDTFLKESSKSSYLPEALYEQGWALKNSGKLKEATAAFEQVVEKSDREVAARAQFMIGEIQFEQKEYKEAVSSYFKAIYGFGDRYPRWQAEALFEAARCFELLSKPDQALKHYEELVQKHPRSDKVPQAKERVTALKKAKSS